VVAVVKLSWMSRAVSPNKAAEMASANQFFDFILERFAFVRDVAMILVVPTVLGHVTIRGFEVLRGGGMR